MVPPQFRQFNNCLWFTIIRGAKLANLAHESYQIIRFGASNQGAKPTHDFFALQSGHRWDHHPVE